MAFDPATVLGSYSGLATFIVLALIIMLAFMANARHAPTFTIAIGAVLAFFMKSGWIPANYPLVAVIVFAGFVGLLVGRGG